VHYHFFAQWTNKDGEVQDQLGPFTTEDREFAVKAAEDHIHHAHTITRFVHGDGVDIQLPYFTQFITNYPDEKPGLVVEWRFTDPDGLTEVSRVVACDGETRSDASLDFVEAMVRGMGGKVVRDNKDGTYIVSLPEEIDSLAEELGIGKKVPLPQ
jgi:hypothetical protein